MRNTLETRLGIFFALALVAAFVIMEMVGGFSVFRGGYRLHSLFNNVQDLKVGDPVKLAGVQVGRIEKMTLVTNQVKVTFKMEKKAQVRTDSKATIKFTGLMGQNFIALDFGSPNGVLASDGTYLQSAEQADLNALMAKLDNVASGVENITKSFTGDNISNLLGPFTDFLKQNREPLSATIANVRTVSDRIAKGEGTVGRLINEDTLYKSALSAVEKFEATANDLQGAASEAKLLLTNANAVVTGINAGEGTLGKLAKDEKLYAETSVAMSNLREILEKVNRGQGSVGKLINDDEFLRNAKLSLQKLDKATEGLEDQGPLSVLGMAVNSLF